MLVVFCYSILLFSIIILLYCRFGRFQVPLGAFLGDHGCILVDLGVSWGRLGSPGALLGMVPGVLFVLLCFEAAPGGGLAAFWQIK